MWFFVIHWCVGSCLYLFKVFKSSKGFRLYLNSIRYIFRDLYTNMFIYSIGASRVGLRVLQPPPLSNFKNKRVIKQSKKK